MGETESRADGAGNRPFPDFANLEREHAGLRQRLLASTREKDGRTLDAADGRARDAENIRKFVARVRATGTVLSADSDRKAAQGILDFWCTELASSPGARTEDYEPVLLAAFVSDTGVPPPAPPSRDVAEKQEQRSSEAIRFAATARLWRSSGRQNGLLALDKRSIEAAKKYRDLDPDIAEWVIASEARLRIRWLTLITVISINAFLAVSAGFIAYFNAQEARQNAEKVDILRDQVVKLDTKLNIELNQPASSEDAAKDMARQDLSPVRPQGQQQGFIWIGSDASDTNKLVTVTGKTPVLARDVKPGTAYLTNRNLVLRRAPPTRDDNYASTESIGVLPAGTRVTALQAPEPPYLRPSGNQYWLKVQTERSDAPIVYLQYTDGSRAEAEALAASLRERGYRIPGVEATDLAKGLSTIRFFYKNDQPAAEKLSKDVAGALAALKYVKAAPVIVDDLSEKPGRRNYPGVIEFWIDLPSRAQ